MKYDSMDEYLYAKYPKILKTNNSPIPLACFGIECGEGWKDLLDAMFNTIQEHIDWSRKQRAEAIQYNRCLKRALNGDATGLYWWYQVGPSVSQWCERCVHRDVREPKYKEIPEATPQVVATQVKEKFGVLRFYYTGGDDIIGGIVAGAESMSKFVCQVCGNRGKLKRSPRGWYSTVCETHEK